MIVNPIFLFLDLLEFVSKWYDLSMFFSFFLFLFLKDKIWACEVSVLSIFFYFYPFLLQADDT